MPTRQQLGKLGARIEAVAAQLGVKRQLFIWHDLEETEQEAWTRAINDNPENFSVARRVHRLAAARGNGLMATRSQLSRLGVQIDRLAAVLNPDDSVVTVVVFEGETPDFALSWHRRQRPEHAGRRVQLQWRREARYEASDLCAVHVSTDADRQELQRFLMQPSLPEGRHFVMPHEDREAYEAHTAELLEQSAQWVRDYQGALAGAGLGAAFAESSTRDQ